MAVNTAGFVCPIDGGNPRIVTGVAFESISGGQAVHASGAADAVSSGLNSLATTDIGLATGASGALFNGVAIQAATSGNAVGVATRGLVIMSAAGACTNGYPAMIVGGGDGVINLASTSGADVPIMVSAAARAKIGRFWSTTAASGSFVLVELTP